MFMYTNVQHNQLTTTNMCLHYELWQDISLSLWVFFKCSSCTVSVVAFLGHNFSMYWSKVLYCNPTIVTIDFSKLGCVLTQMHGILLYKHQHTYMYILCLALKVLLPALNNYHGNSNVQYLAKAHPVSVRYRPVWRFHAGRRPDQGDLPWLHCEQYPFYCPWYKTTKLALERFFF